jgi:hypothetical protein
MALLVILVIRFGYIARFQWGVGGDLLLAYGGYYLPSLGLEEGEEGVQHRVGNTMQ